MSESSPKWLLTLTELSKPPIRCIAINDEPPIGKARHKIVSALKERGGMTLGQIAANTGMKMANINDHVRTLFDRGVLNRDESTRPFTYMVAR